MNLHTQHIITKHHMRIVFTTPPRAYRHIFTHEQLQGANTKCVHIIFWTNIYYTPWCARDDVMHTPIAHCRRREYTMCSATSNTPRTTHTHDCVERQEIIKLGWIWYEWAFTYNIRCDCIMCMWLYVIGTNICTSVWQECLYSHQPVAICFVCIAIGIRLYVYYTLYEYSRAVDWVEPQ